MPGPESLADRNKGPTLAEARKSDSSELDDHFPISSTVALSSFSQPTPEPGGIVPVVSDREVPLDQIKEVAAWTERRLEARRDLPPRGGIKLTAGPAESKVAVARRKSEPRPRPGASAAKKGRPDRGAPRTRTAELGLAVPYIVQGILQEKEPALQDRCCQALTRMAPLARDAVPVLAKKLEQCRTPSQQKVVVEVLKNFGPAARSAAPALANLAANGSAVVRPKAEEALQYICPGVQDSANVLNAHRCQLVNEQARTLAQKHHFYFVAETVSRLPGNPAWDADKKKQVVADFAYRRSRETNAERGVFILICPESKTVEVTLGAALQGKDSRLVPETIRQTIQESLQSNKLEQGLEAAVRLVDRELSSR
jgi:hypothetical protein